MDLIAAWVSVPDLRVQPDGQRYTAAGANRIRYDALDGSFSAMITVDEDGLVIDYPGIARRVCAQPAAVPDNLPLNQVRGEPTAEIRGTVPGQTPRAGSPVQLSGMDMSFLLHERRGAHMHVGGVACSTVPLPSYEELREHVSERLQLVPRFRQKLAFPPLPLSRPWWVDDPQFNLDYHLRQIALPRGGDTEQLKSLIARVFSQRLDRGKPLWEMYFAEGLEGGRFALITKAHHALLDGISGVDLARVIMDAARNRRPPGCRRPVRAPPGRRRAPSWRCGASSAT